MASEWSRTTVGSFCPFSYGKGLPEKKRKPNGSFKVYGSNGPVGTHDQPLVDQPGIVIGRKGTVGAVHFASEPFWPIDTTFYVVSTSDRHLRYTYYLLKSVGLENMNADSAVPGLNRDAAHARQILVPPFEEQRAIAHILGSLDDKIELNRRMNETLEAMARAIFKSWFVDFLPVRAKQRARTQTGEPVHARRGESRFALNLPPEILDLFPDSFQDSELGPIPKGWEVLPLSEVVNIIGGGTPKTKVKEYWGGDIPWFSVVDAPTETDVFVIDTEKHITKLGANKSSTKVLRKGTTIISARGTVGKCALVGRPMAMNQSCYGIQGKKGESDYFVYFTIRRQVSDLQRSGHGSVFNTITRDTFRTIQIACPPTNLTTSYEEIVHPLMELVLANLYENASLTTLRDTLLPKLISGELRVPAAALEGLAAQAGVPDAEGLVEPASAGTADREAGV